jgi:hypothetical protein
LPNNSSVYSYNTGLSRGWLGLNVKKIGKKAKRWRQASN